jgi:2-polyprenyl-6-methoxyphenol hydroxylase-like FAD-dependent oxidoreductase
MSKSIIIIGAGLAGLATGCYAQMNGYKTKIFELQANPARATDSILKSSISTPQLCLKIKLSLK